MATDYLKHYGVLGMKWGVRKDRSKSASSMSKRRKSTMSEDAKLASDLKKKKVSEMSNAELRKLNDRIQLEQNYSRLRPNALKKGLAIAGATAATLGTVMNLYNNGGKVVDLGKKIGNGLIDRVGDVILRDLEIKI